MAKVKRVKAWALVRQSWNFQIVSVKFEKYVAKALLKLLNKKAIVKYKVVPCEIVIKTKVDKIFRRLLCPDCGNIVDMEYVGYKSKPYKAHRYKCHRCGETCLSSKPKKAVSK
jgi:predicted RNA-binding Zn-ribbon protein involved in translation (DUF1610 family)